MEDAKICDMASECLIPKRPENDSEFSKIKAADKDMMGVSVVFGWSNERVYAMFHPDCKVVGGLNAKGKRDCAQFFAYARNREYMDAYRKTIAGGRIVPNSADMEINDSRKDKALKSLFNHAMSLVEGNVDLDADTLKAATEIFKKIGLLRDDDVSVEAPRRYLPARCHSECQYRLFCEKAIENGEIENECLYCKALVIAQEHGYVYDPTTNLSIPEDKG